MLLFCVMLFRATLRFDEKHLKINGIIVIEITIYCVSTLSLHIKSTIWEHFHPVKISCKTIYITFCTIAAKSGIQLKPASNMQLGQQKPTPVPLRPQASHTVQASVQQPNSQQRIPRRSTQQAQQAGLQEPAEKKADIHLNPLQSRHVKQQDHPNPTLRQKAVERPVEKGAQTTTSQQPQCKIPSHAPAAVTKSPKFEPEVFSQQEKPPKSVKQTQHIGTQMSAVKQDIHLNPLQSRCVEQQNHPTPTLQQCTVKRPVQQKAQGSNSQQPQSTTPSHASTVLKGSPTIQPVVSKEYDDHFPVSSYNIMYCSDMLLTYFVLFTHTIDIGGSSKNS